MHIWIDIDNHKHVPFIKALVTELKEKGHNVTVTAEDRAEIKQAINKFSLETKLIVSTFSIFGMFEEQIIIIRAHLLSDYIKDKNITLAFSLGSRPIPRVCLELKIPIISLLEDYKQKIHWIYHTLYNSFFLISDTIPDSLMIEQGYDINLIAKYKGNSRLENLEHDIKAIKNIIDQMSYLSGKMNIAQA